MDDTGNDEDAQDTSNAADDAASDVDEDGSRIEELGDRIGSVRAQAEEAVEGVAEPDDETAAPG